MSSAADYPTLQALLSQETTPVHCSGHAQTSTASTSSNGAFGVAIVAVLKKPTAEVDVPPPVLRYLAASLYLPYVAPNLIQAFSSPGRWFTVANDVVTTVALCKTLADNTDILSKKKLWTNYLSPVAESLLNSVWLVPAGVILCAINRPQTSDWLSFAGNCLLISGAALPFAAKRKSLRATCVIA